MHELSIAMSIIDIAEETSALHGGLRISAIHLRLGRLAGVVKDALLSSYEMARENTPLAGSKLVIEDIPGVIYCKACDACRPVSSSEWFCCVECGGITSEIVQGKELEVASLEVES